VRSFGSTRIVYKKADVTQAQKPEGETEPAPAPKQENQKHERNRPRKNATKTSSLRRVAVEAQRSRGFVKGRGSKRFVDPDVDTKVSVGIP
jgi:hypothetical protein